MPARRAGAGMSRILSSILAKRDHVGAASPIGRQLTVVAQVLQVIPGDEDHARRRKTILERAVGLLEDQRGGAA
jgi:hypothetical protein